MTEDEMAGWHHCAMDTNPGKLQEMAGGRQGGLACCGHEVRDLATKRQLEALVGLHRAVQLQLLQH